MSAPVEHKIVAARFGTIAGTEVSLFRIPNSTNDYIEVSDYGCTIKGIHVHGKDGKLHNVLCGYETLEEYQVGGLELGAVTGTLNGQPLPTAHRLWNVEEIGENHLFLSCRLSAEDTPAGIACALGARIMWVNLNRIVIDLFATPEKDACLALTSNLVLRLQDPPELTGYTLRTFCPEVLLDGQRRPVSQSDYAEMTFVPLAAHPQTFVSDRDESKPMAELVHTAAAFTVSAYSTMSAIRVSPQPGLGGVQVLPFLLDGLSLAAGQSFAGRIICGFDRLYTKEELEESALSPFAAFI